MFNLNFKNLNCAQTFKMVENWGNMLVVSKIEILKAKNGPNEKFNNVLGLFLTVCIIRVQSQGTNTRFWSPHKDIDIPVTIIKNREIIMPNQP